MLLEKCTGPACPRCGCQDCEIKAMPPAIAAAGAQERQAKWGVASWFAAGRARCRHCGLAFSFRELPPAEEVRNQKSEVRTEAVGIVPFPVTACPHCNSPQIKVTSTRKPYRHHKCDGCGKSFKSKESG